MLYNCKCKRNIPKINTPLGFVQCPYVAIEGKPRPNKRHRAIDNQRHRFAACIYQEEREGASRLSRTYHYRQRDLLKNI